MKRELKVGDKGYVYGYGRLPEDTFPVLLDKIKCIIAYVHRLELIIDTLDMTNNFVGLRIHKKSFIPFKQKEKPREFWVNVYPKGSISVYYSEKEAVEIKPSDKVQTVRVIEAREKK